jgi:hypothetical protein
LKTSAQAAAEAFPPETKHRANMKRYAVYGALFGVVFPLIALCFRWAENGFEQALASLNLDPLFWIICTAPLFLGLFAALAGNKRRQREHRTAHGPHKDKSKKAREHREESKY